MRGTFGNFQRKTLRSLCHKVWISISTLLYFTINCQSLNAALLIELKRNPILPASLLGKTSRPTFIIQIKLVSIQETKTMFLLHSRILEETKQKKLFGWLPVYFGFAEFHTRSACYFTSGKQNSTFLACCLCSCLLSPRPRCCSWRGGKKKRCFQKQVVR